MRKSVRVLTVLSVLVLTMLLGAGSQALAAKYTMKISLPSPMVEWTQFNEPYAVLKNEIEKRSGGQIEVKLYPAGTLGNMTSATEQVRKGIIQGVQVGDGWIANHFPEIQLLSIPYVFKDRDVAWKVLDGPFGKELLEAYTKKTGLRLLHLTENGGFRCFSNNVRTIKTPADMKGMKIRVMPNPAHQETVKALGALPVVVPWAELYTALKTGVADGQENAVATFLVPKLWEVQKYMTLDGHFYSINSVIINNDWYKKLPTNLQRAIDQAAMVSKTVNRGICTALESKGITMIQKKGMKVYAPTAAEKEMFRKMCQAPVIEFIKADFKKKGVDTSWIDRFMKAVDQAEKELGYK
jgi:tripartite ATP-independent transporter DctP family solute receptor